MRNAMIVLVVFLLAFAIGLVPLMADGPMMPPCPWCPPGPCMPCSMCAWYDVGCWLTCTWIANCGGGGGG